MDVWRCRLREWPVLFSFAGHTIGAMKALALAFFAIFWGLAIREDAAEDLSKNYIDRRAAQADLLFEQGHTTDSKQIYEALLAALRQGPPSAQLGFVLNGLSKIAGAEGDYTGA